MMDEYEGRVIVADFLTGDLDHTDISAIAEDFNRWRRKGSSYTITHMRMRRNVPIVDGTITRNGNTAWVAPARLTSTHAISPSTPAPR